MIIMVLFVVTMFLWLLALLPPPVAILGPARPWLAFAAVLLLGITLYAGRF